MNMHFRLESIKTKQKNMNDELLGKREHGVSSKDKNDELNGYATYYGWY